MLVWGAFAVVGPIVRMRRRGVGLAGGASGNAADGSRRWLHDRATGLHTVGGQRGARWDRPTGTGCVPGAQQGACGCLSSAAGCVHTRARAPELRQPPGPGRAGADPFGNKTRKLLWNPRCEREELRVRGGDRCVLGGVGMEFLC